MSPPPARRPCASRRFRLDLRFAGLALLLLSASLSAARVDGRLHDVLYSADEVYRLPGYVGYAIDLQFAPGERFLGVGSGDVDGLALAAEANHLFIKPKALGVRTDLTVLTSRRIYHFDYETMPRAPDPDHADVIYALRFLYPPSLATAPAAQRPSLPTPEALLAGAGTQRRNSDYWYCGNAQLRPVGAWDDGVQTHLHFSMRAELPVVFVLNDDGSEALVNFHVERTDIVVHRIARRLVLRRGRLSGCIVNHSFRGSGTWLPTGTLSPEVLRSVRQVDTDAPVR